MAAGQSNRVGAIGHGDCVRRRMGPPDRVLSRIPGVPEDQRALSDGSRVGKKWTLPHGGLQDGQTDGSSRPKRQKEIRNGRWESLEVMALLLGCYMLDICCTVPGHKPGSAQETPIACVLKSNKTAEKGREKICKDFTMCHCTNVPGSLDVLWQWRVT